MITSASSKYKELLNKQDDDDRKAKLEDLRKKQLREEIKRKREQEDVRKREQRLKEQRAEEARLAKQKQEDAAKQALLKEEDEKRKRPLSVEEAKERRKQAEAARNSQGMGKMRQELPRKVISSKYSSLLAAAPTKLDKVPPKVRPVVPAREVRPEFRPVPVPRPEVRPKPAAIVKTPQSTPIQSPPRKVKPAKPHQESIWEIMNPGKSRQQYLARDIDSDEDDMEADAESIRREELRAAKQARLEDEREARLLAEQEARKAKRRKV